MIINVHAGHNRYAPGASKFLDEVKENRIVKNRLINRLDKVIGVDVYDTTDEIGKTAREVVKNIVEKCNSHNADLDISIHLNAGGGKGVEVWNYDDRTQGISSLICKKISEKLDLKNRGTKYTRGLYVLNNTKAKAILIECCFTDSREDYEKWGGNLCADAIFAALKEYYDFNEPSDRAEDAKTEHSHMERIAEDIIAGKYGNGIRRKRAIEKMGYNYREIQNIVNRKLRK